MAPDKKPKTKTIKETTSEWELLNDVKAVWLRSPKEVTDEEYSKFYHSLAKVKTVTMSLYVHTKFQRKLCVCALLRKPCLNSTFFSGLR